MQSYRNMVTHNWSRYYYFYFSSTLLCNSISMLLNWVNELPGHRSWKSELGKFGDFDDTRIILNHSLLAIFDRWRIIAQNLFHLLDRYSFLWSLYVTYKATLDVLLFSPVLYFLDCSPSSDALKSSIYERIWTRIIWMVVE